MNKLILMIILSVSVGCSGFGRKMKSLVSGKSSSPKVQRKSVPSFAKNDRYMRLPNRDYKRMTKKKLSETAQLKSSSGSLWVMEGQGAYLFSQNIVRMIGDPLKVKLNGEPKEQLKAKVKVVADLTKKLQEKLKRKRRLATAGKASSKKKKTAKPKAKVSTQASKEELDEIFKVQSVPTRITERMIDGNYRVKGTQPIMIGSREYRIIVMGVVRSQDFNEEGVSSTQLLDPKFDLVSSRRSRL